MTSTEDNVVSFTQMQHGTAEDDALLDRFERKAAAGLADHPWYQLCVDFCAQWDQNSFDPAGPLDPLELFVDDVREVFGRTPWDPAVIAAGPGILVG